MTDIVRVDGGGLTIGEVMDIYQAEGMTWDSCPDPDCPDWELHEGIWLEHHHPGHAA